MAQSWIKIPNLRRDASSGGLAL